MLLILARFISSIKMIVTLKEKVIGMRYIVYCDANRRKKSLMHPAHNPKSTRKLGI